MPTLQKHLLESMDDCLEAWSADRKLPAYRCQQVRRWLFEKRAADWEAMSDLPKQLRGELAESFSLWTTEVAKHTRAEDGTEKLLLQLPDGGQVECVLLRGRMRRTLCVSTQVGCGMGCTFCASGLDGVERNLTTGEIVEQMLRLQRLLDAEERVSHIVVMGMGEPLAALDSLLPALAEARRSDGLDVSARRITISTVGLPQAIDRLTRDQATYRLAISLHAPTDALRNELVPVNRRIGLAAIMASADRYFAASGRRMTFEYVLLGGVNDHPEHADQLAQLIGRREALVNVIPYNPVAGLPYRTPQKSHQDRFQQILESANIRVRFRHRKGSKIDAACGQLRRAHLQKKPAHQ